MVAFLLGLGSGVVISLLAKLVETSRLAFGPFAFYGNGALIIPALGAGLAIYGLWTWILRRDRRRVELLWSTLGLYLGVGAVALPSLPGLLFTGALFVLPTAGMSYGAYRALSRPGSAGAVVRTGFVCIGLALALPMPMLAVGLMVGPFIATAARAPGQVPTVLGALLALVLVAGGIAVPLLFIG